MHDVTFLIKTFERPECFRRCVRSIYAQHPGVSLVVVEDSLKPYARELAIGEFAGCPISVFELPADQGISAGRNYGVERIRTPYFVLLDDDHTLRPDSGVERMRAALVSGGWDIVGGSYVHYDAQGRPFLWCWEGELLQVDTVLVCRRATGHTDLVACDIVNNFFLARTDSVRAVGGWDPVLKILEHVDFFLRAKPHGLRVAHLPGALIDHWVVRGGDYDKYRVERVQHYRRLWMEKHGLSHLITFDGRVFVLPHLWPSNCDPLR